MNLQKEDLISIIIPVFNTAEYLRRCLDSVCNQTYRNLEIICVDDGSTDGSEDIVDYYAGKDNRIIAIHKENGGESDARNAGLRKSSGQFIGFMDCDDWIEADMYQKLMSIMKEHDVDIVASCFYKEGVDGSEKVTNEYQVSDKEINRTELLNYVFQRDNYKGFTGYIWNKLFKREILYNERGQLLQFDTGLKLGGDLLYFIQLACRVNRVIYTPEAYYHYIQRPSSTWHSINIGVRKDVLLTYEKIICLLEKENFNEDILIWVKRFMAYHASLIAKIAYGQQKKKELDYCQNIMKRYQAEYEFSNSRYPDRITEFRNILQF